MSKAGKPIWPKIPSGFVRAVLAGHSALGLAFAALIYLVCFSGTVAVFAEEFHRWEQPAAPRMAAISPAALQTAVEGAITEYGKAEHIFISLPTDGAPRVSLYLDRAAGDLELFADAQGQLTDPAPTPWTDFMTTLHIYLHLPRSWGIFVVGLTGVALLSSLISGIFSHPRVFRDAFHLRWGGSKRLQEADLHNRISIWALPFHVTIALTGALLGLTTIIAGVLALALFQGDVGRAYDLFLPPAPQDDPRPAPLPRVDTALAQVARMTPEAVATYVSLEHPGEQGQSVQVLAGAPGRLSAGENYVFDGTGRPLTDAPMGGETLGAQIIQAIGQLHFGWFGGWPIKLVYAVLGAGLTVVTTSGVAIWLARRRDKGRPAPMWERIWIATVWSQPLAFGASAALAFIPAIPPLASWAIVTLLGLGAAFVWTAPAAISRRLRLASALCLGLAVIAHMAVWRGAAADPVAWITNAVAMLLAAGLVLSVWPRTARPLGAPSPAPAE